MNALVRAPLHGEILAPGDTVTVVAATHPLRGDRHVVEMPAGSSIAEIVERVSSEFGLSRLARGADVSIDGHLILSENWHRVRVKAGAHVLVQGRVGKAVGNILRSIFMIALSVLATFIVGPAGLGIAGLLGGGTIGAIGASVVAGAIMMGGGLLANALFPPTPTKSATSNPSYSIAAGRNAASKWGALPVILGKVRANPKYAATGYTEFVGKDQYLRMLFVWGYGPMKISDIRIGDTSIDDYDDVEIETREGYADDQPQTLYPSEVVQEDLSIEPAYNVAVVHTSAEDASEIVIDFVAPQGLVRVDDDGDRHAQSCTFLIEMSPAGANAWVSKGTAVLNGSKSNDPIRQSFRYIVSGGQWDVRVTRQTGDSERSTVFDTVVWSALKTFRIAPAIDFRKPLAITAIRIRASKQLNGTIDNLNALVSTVATSWDGNSWVAGQETRNPGDLVRLVLQGPANARPQPDSRLDLTTIAAFADHCTANGYAFDMYRDFTASVRDTLRDICAAGRAVPTFRDGKWSVAWEESDAPIIQHFTPRNSRDFTWTQTYRVFPHGLRCKFVNAAKDYVEDEILVFDAGYTKANATLYEQAEFPGVTSAAIINKHAKYRIADARARPAVYRLTVDFEHLVAQRTDRVALAYDVIQEGIASGRIQAIDGQKLTLDEPAVMEAGKLYGIRIRRPDGTSVVRQVTTEAGTQKVITIAGDVPEIGDLYTFGIRGSETGIFRILAIQPGEDLSAELQLVDDGANVQDGDGDDDTPTPVAPTPVALSAYTPTNLRAESDVVQVEVGSVYRTRLYWNAVGGPSYSSFEVVATSDGRTIVHIEGADTRASDFTDLADGEWSFTVRAFLTDGRYTPPSAVLIVPINVPTGQTGVALRDLTEQVHDIQENFASQIRTLSEMIAQVALGDAEGQFGAYQDAQAVYNKVKSETGDVSTAVEQAILAATGPDSGIATAITALNGAANGQYGDATWQISTEYQAASGWDTQWGVQVRASTSAGWADAGLFARAKSDGTAELLLMAGKVVIVDTDSPAEVNAIVFDDGKAYLNDVIATSIEVKSAATGARTIITDSLIQVFDANNVERVRLGVWDE